MAGAATPPPASPPASPPVSPAGVLSGGAVLDNGQATGAPGGSARRYTIAELLRGEAPDVKRAEYIANEYPHFYRWLRSHSRRAVKGRGAIDDFIKGKTYISFGKNRGPTFDDPRILALRDMMIKGIPGVGTTAELENIQRYLAKQTGMPLLSSGGESSAYSPNYEAINQAFGNWLLQTKGYGGPSPKITPAGIMQGDGGWGSDLGKDSRGKPINFMGFMHGAYIDEQWPIKKTEQSKITKALGTIGKILPGIARPIMNIAKAMGDMAAGVGRYGSSFVGGFSHIIGNPFDANVLNSVADMGSQPGMLAGAFMSGVGGMISGVGEGIGRLANNAVPGGGNMALGDGGAGGKVGKLGAVGMAGQIVGAFAGIVGTLISAMTQAIMSGFNIAVSLLKSINRATLKILGTSPLLETIKNILNLAFTMAFLPMSTAILQDILPSVLGLLDKAVEFGQSFRLTAEQTESIKNAFDRVISTVVDFFYNNSDKLASFIAGSIELLPKMMELQLGLIELFVNNKEQILDLCTYTIDTMKKMLDSGLLNKLLDFAKEAVSFIERDGIVMAEAAIACARILLRLADHFMPGTSKSVQDNLPSINLLSGRKTKVSWDFGPAGTIRNVISLLGSSFASGGYVPATPGGVPCIIGEGGEGEYVIPESKIGGVTIVFSGNVYGMNDFKSQVRNIMNEYTTKANFR